ncbi:MAG: hypothetical protein AAF466_12445, partial [Bacteroidota bacterium]
GDFVIQDAGVNHFEVRDNGGVYIGGDTFWLDENTSGTAIARLSDSFDHGIFQVYNSNTFQHTLHGAGTTVFNETGGDYNLRIESDGNANMFFVDAGTNRVGIGTAIPGYTLDVNGDINTSGNIRQSGGAYSFPDYVFESYFDGFSECHSTYTLKPLPEVAVFLKRHKHLPGVQSRSEVEANGWNISENVRTNLEKIEELYLYAIEANATIERQQTQIDRLTQLVDRLVSEKTRKK